MKILKLKLYQETACYKKPFAFKVAETYPLPPYSTVIGMLHKIIQAESGEYFPMNISIQGEFESIFSNYQWMRKYLQESDKKNNNNSDFITKPLTVHMLLNINLIIHVQAEDEIIDKIYNNIISGKETITLGRNEDIVRIDDIKIVTSKEVGMQNIKQSVYIPEYIVNQNNKIHGINYRLNTKYTINSNGLREWEKINVKYIEKENDIGTIIKRAVQDNEGDLIFFMKE